MTIRPRLRFAALIICLITCFDLLPGAFSLRASGIGGKGPSAVIDEIIKEEADALGASGAQELLDSVYSKTAGDSNDWFVFSLARYKGERYDFSRWANALVENVKKSGKADSRQALLLAVMGAGKKEISGFLDQPLDGMGIMTGIYSLHLLNSSCSSPAYSAESLIGRFTDDWLLPDGGWALNGTKADTDVTAMAVQALAPHRNSSEAVRSAVDKALGILSSRQLADGGYKNFYGDECPETAAQVIVALTSLGIDPQKDERFIKNGRSVVDGMLSFRGGRGCSHTADGEYNALATAQTLYALVSMHRLRQGMSGLYVIDKSLSVDITEPDTSSARPYPAGTGETVTTAAKAEETTKKTETKTTDAASTGAAEKSAAGQTSATERAPETKPTRSVRRKADATGAAAGKKENKKTETAEKTGSVKHARTSAAYEEEPVSETDPPESEAISAEALSEEGHAVIEAETEAAEESVSEQTEEDAPAEKKAPPIKAVLSVCAVFAGVAAAALLFFLKKNRKPLNYIIIAAVTAAAVSFIAFADIKTPDEYYVTESVTAADTITATIEIRCDTVAGRGDEEMTPSDGVILEKTEYTLEKGATVYDCLIKAAKENRLQLEDSSQTLSDHSLAYIAGINYLYEFDYGEMSGWMYSVNGSFADKGCGEYVLEDGDEISWRYTCDLGDDLK